jgi:hypothetical protein
MCKTITNKGYELYDKYYIKLTRNLKFMQKAEDKLEPIYVFKKKDNNAIIHQ